MGLVQRIQKQDRVPSTDLFLECSPEYVVASRTSELYELRHLQWCSAFPWQQVRYLLEGNEQGHRRVGRRCEMGCDLLECNGLASTWLSDDKESPVPSRAHQESDRSPGVAAISPPAAAA